MLAHNYTKAISKKKNSMKLRKTVWPGRALWTKPFATVQRTINPIKAVSASIDLNVIVLLVSKPEVNQETNNVVRFCLFE